MISPNTDFINKRKGNKNFMKEGEYLMPGEFLLLIMVFIELL